MPPVPLHFVAGWRSQKVLVLECGEDISWTIELHMITNYHLFLIQAIVVGFSQKG